MLVHKTKVSGDVSAGVTSNCDTNGQACSLGGLKHGREYSLAVYSCVVEIEALCGRDSHPLATRTVAPLASHTWYRMQGCAVHRGR